MTTTSSKIQKSEMAQARSAAYSFIAIGFQYPSIEIVGSIANPQQWAGWSIVLKTLDSRIEKLFQSFGKNIRKEAVLVTESTNGALDNLQCHYDKLFGHAVRGKCPAYEMEYGRNEIIRQAADLADLAGFYHAFGMESANGANSRPDHITAECEFMSVLCSKEAHALMLDEEEKIDVSVNAERTFLKDHLAGWLPAFAHRIEEADYSTFYTSIAQFAKLFIEVECDQFDIQSGPTILELNPADPVKDRTINCGTGDCGTTQAGDKFVQLNTDTDSDPNCDDE